MGNRKFAPIAMLLTAFALLAGVIGSASAQGTNATPAAGIADVIHPAHIHAGTCDELGEVVFPLNEVATANMPAGAGATPTTGMDATPSPGLASTPVVGNPVVESTTTIIASLDEILAEDHAINVHQSPDNIDVYIACGNITGEPEAGLLNIDLQELNGSGYTGEATLVANDDGTTNVTVTLFFVGEATPAATPAS